jgi:hypothetical protein
MPRYLVEHHHEPSECTTIRTWVVRSARERPPGLRDAYWEPGAHRGWLVIDADDHLALNDVIGTIIEHSTNVVHAVLDLAQLERLDEESS